jgi:hypothetical protein
MVAQGCATVHGFASLPVLDTYATVKPGAANTGATSTNAESKTVMAQSFAIIRIMYRPFDVASDGGAIIV